MAQRNADRVQHADVLDVEEASKEYHVHIESIRRWIRQRKLPVINPKANWVVRREDIEACLTHSEEMAGQAK